MNDDEIARSSGFASDEEKARFECDARERAMGASGACQPRGSGDFSIGGKIWPGTSKLLEEMGELQQVLGKLIATHGDTKHWSGDLRKMLVDEMSDVGAALAFFKEQNLTREERAAFAERLQKKVALFQEWQKNPTKP